MTPNNELREQEQNHRYGDHLEGYQLGGGRGRMGEKVQGLRRIIGRWKNRKGDVKNSIGNGEDDEFISMIHGHEIKRGICGGKVSTSWSGTKSGKIGTAVIV